MTTQELLRAIAYLIALEARDTAEQAAAELPEWFDLVDVIRAGDGLQQLARAIDRRHRSAA